MGAGFPAHGQVNIGRQENAPLAIYLSPELVILDVKAMEATGGVAFDADARRVAAAISILGRMLGHEWIDSRIRLDKSKDGRFLNPPALVPTDKFKSAHRLVALAEHLLNLQGVEGFETCLQEVYSDKIETGLAKLIAARMLYSRGVPFRFVVPSGQIGKDYDAEATIGGSLVAVEMKARVEGRDLAPGVIANSLKRARKQLPKTTPNIVFLRVPDTWGFTEVNRLYIAADVRKEFKDSRTLGAVVIHWERWSQIATPEMPDGAVANDRLFVFLSKRARVEFAGLANALLKFDEKASSSWVTLDALFSPTGTKPQRVQVPRTADFPFDLDKLTLIGSAKLTYAHLCTRAYLDPLFPTWERIRRIVRIRTKEGNGLPDGSTLVLRIQELGPFTGKRLLKVLFGSSAYPEGQWRQAECEFASLSGGSSRVANFSLDVSGFKLYGPGIYTFEFILGEQLLGRLPILVYEHEFPDARVPPSPLQMARVTLDYGHVVERVVPPSPDDPEGAMTFRRVMEVIPLKESVPFGFDPAALVFGLSAPEGVPREHIVSITARRVDGTILNAAEMSIVLQPGLPGELISLHSLSLSQAIVFPGEGDYEFVIKVDGRDVGIVELPAPVVKVSG